MSGSLAYSPSKIIATLLVQIAVGTDTESADWRVFYESTPTNPDEVITVFDTANLLEGSVMFGETQEQHGIMIQVRSGEYDPGWVIINSLRTLLDQVNQATVVVEGSVFNVHCLNRTSGPFHIGLESNISKRDLFTINFTASIRQVS